VKKELRPVHDAVTCDVCGRTILKGERTETYLAPGGHRHQVCDLCAVRAQHSGWLRESGAGDLPHRSAGPEPRRGLLGRMRRRRPEGFPPAETDEVDADLAEGSDALEPEEAQPASRPPRPRSRPKDPRHVRAVPTTAEAKVDRALELFNGSQHQRTIAGLARTLGAPLVSARPDPGQGSQVSVVVAWELSWYRYRVDLGDEGEPVEMLEKGEEIPQIDESLREWNASLDGDGRVLPGPAGANGGPEA
jgi:hypothetical protein